MKRTLKWLRVREPRDVARAALSRHGPGQGLAYKVGTIKILELRELARTALGSKFDIREFHDQVVGNGAMPLSVLERVIDEYVARKKAA